MTTDDTDAPRPWLIATCSFFGTFNAKVYWLQSQRLCTIELEPRPKDSVENAAQMQKNYDHLVECLKKASYYVGGFRADNEADALARIEWLCGHGHVFPIGAAS
jgi:hypothetical protein